MINIELNQQSLRQIKRKVEERLAGGAMTVVVQSGRTAPTVRAGCRLVPGGDGEFENPNAIVDTYTHGSGSVGAFLRLFVGHRMYVFSYTNAHDTPPSFAFSQDDRQVRVYEVRGEEGHKFVRETIFAPEAGWLDPEYESPPADTDILIAERAEHVGYYGKTVGRYFPDGDVFIDLYNRQIEDVRFWRPLPAGPEE